MPHLDRSFKAHLVGSEDLTFAPDLDEFGRDIKGQYEWQIFQDRALNFMRSGVDTWSGQTYVGLENVSPFFQPESSPEVFIITPQMETAPAINDDGTDEFNDVQPDPTEYLPGLLYQAKVDLLRNAIFGVLGDTRIPATMFVYQALNKRSFIEVGILDNTGRGKSLFEYDPDLDGSGNRRGSRLIIEGLDWWAITGNDAIHIEQGVIYRDDWSPNELAGLGEDRILSVPNPEDTDLLSCGEQYYYEHQVCSFLTRPNFGATNALTY